MFKAYIMKTINKSYLLKAYYGSANFYKNVKSLIKNKTYSITTLKGAVNIMWDLGTINTLK